MGEGQPLRLEPGMFYATNFSRRGAFDLYDGQMYPDPSASSIHLNNAVWLNSRGERIGFGDLQTLDLVRIATYIPKDEVFVTVYQGYLRSTNASVYGSQFQTQSADHIADFVSAIVTVGKVRLVDMEIDPERSLFKRMGIIETITKEQASEILKQAREAGQ